MNLEIYEPTIKCETHSVLSGKTNGMKDYSELPDIPVIKAFLEDNDLQHITVASANIGFIRKYEKIYKK